MYSDLTDFYLSRVFDCTSCQQKLLNPYLHCNPKHDPPNSPEFPGNRRKFQLDYIASKEHIRIVIIGEAPGLDGCGFGGIAFTGEYNAVLDLGLPNYHGTVGNFQKEQSANLVYGTLKVFCRSRNISLTETAAKIYLTNAIMCVPLAKTGRSITAPAGATRRQCRENLIRQLEIIRPELVITLGANALGAVSEALDIRAEKKLTQLVRDFRQSGHKISTPWGFELLPEIHPSPRNRVLGSLYTDLETRLAEIFTEYLD